jgi:ABC-type transport system substrate-binding protein
MITNPRTGVLRILAALALVALGAAACTSGSPSGSTADGPATSAPSVPQNSTSGPADAAHPVDGGHLEFGMEAEPEGLDPLRYAFAASAHLVASAVFDPLATLDADGRAVPYLASAITSSDGYTTWTITIPTGISFSDGTPLTAGVVSDDLEAYRHSYITQLALQTVTSVSAPDATHVVVHLNAPMVDFPSLLTTQLGYVFAPIMRTDPNLVDKPIGTGPFILTGHTKDKVWSVTKNPHYWRAGLPHLDSIDFRPVPDNATRLSELEHGDLDVIVTVRPTQIEQIRSSSDLKVVENPTGEEDFLVLNTQQAPFDQLVARQAVAYATDSARWRKEQMDDLEAPANSPFAPGQLGYVADNGFPAFDLDKARQLVAQYTKDTGKPFEFSYVMQDDTYNAAENQFFVDAYTKAGMKVTTQAFPQINLTANIATGHYQLGRFRLYSAPNPDTDANEFWRSSSVLPPPDVSLNWPRFVDPKVDTAINDAMASTDPRTRDADYQVVNREFATNLPYIWLGRPDWVMAASSDVNGIYAAKNGTIQTVGPKTWLADLWLQH